MSNRTKRTLSLWLTLAGLMGGFLPFMKATVEGASPADQALLASAMSKASGWGWQFTEGKVLGAALGICAIFAVGMAMQRASRAWSIPLALVAGLATFVAAMMAKGNFRTKDVGSVAVSVGPHVGFVVMAGALVALLVTGISLAARPAPRA